ncbi:MAG TPA: HEAT repeat domain-containing protein [Chloroflexia bacterium]|nr:HEAT repeat domain-containing protein [Chloroflexia bacterium]
MSGLSADQLLDQLLNQSAKQVQAWLNRVNEGHAQAPEGFNWILLAEIATRQAKWPQWMESLMEDEYQEPNLAWAEVAIAIYDHMAQHEHPSFRPPATEKSMLLRAWIIERMGSVPGHPILGTEPLVRWFFETPGIAHSTPYSLRNTHSLKVARQESWEFRELEQRLRILARLVKKQQLNSDTELNEWLLSLEKLDENTRIELIHLLRNKNAASKKRQWAVYELGGLHDPTIIEPLLEVLNDEDKVVAQRAAGLLGKLGDQKAIEPLIMALNDSAEEVRRYASISLGALGDKNAVLPLMAALKDPSPAVRAVAAAALGRLGDLRALEPLISALQDTESGVRQEAVQALGKLGAK